MARRPDQEEEEDLKPAVNFSNKTRIYNELRIQSTKIAL